MATFPPRLILLWILILQCLHCNSSGIGKNLNSISETDDVILESINGTSDFRMTKKSRDNRPWYDGRENKRCVREAKCEKLNSKHEKCLGTTLPYSDISLHLTYGGTQEKVFERLEQYSVLKNIPKCWVVVQPFLCATFMPKCEKINGRDMVHLPSLEMCRKIIDPCKLVYNTSIFPEFLKCNNTFYHSDCYNEVIEMKFNTTGQCLPPLVHTDLSFRYYDGITDCALPCRDPLYTEEEHNQIRRLVFWGGSISLILTIFTISTFLIDWRSANKYPALVIFYINVCYMISSIGWLSQFISDSRGDIVCSEDGTRRSGEPSAGENLSCVTIFVLVYYFLIAACVWFVIFTYAWHMSFRALGKIQDRIDKKGAYFHLIAWSLPLVLTITTMALGEVDGSSITGICFVGYLNHPIRAGFLLGPLLAVLLIGGFFLSCGLYTLVTVRISSKDIISVRASSKIRSTIMRGAITAIFVFLFITVTFLCHIYEFSNSSSWHDSFRSFLICKLTQMYRDLNPQECKQEARPSLAILQLQLLCLFSSVCLMASWVFTGATIQTWKRYIRKKCGFEVEEPIKLQKHKLIAQAYIQRNELHNQGRMSISFHNTHTDPVGLNFELNSASHDFSSTWANYLPRFVKRRGALTGHNSHSQSSSAPRRNSQDSQISFSLRHVSVESRRNSLDSQVSVKIAEMKTKVASRRRLKPHKLSRRRAHRNSTIYTRKESTTSIESQIGTHIVRAVASTKERHDNAPYISNRKKAMVGLNQDEIDLLLANGKLVLPFLQNQGLTTTSDEDNGSMTSFKVRDSRLNIVLHKKESHLSTDDVGINSSSNGIAQYHSDSNSDRNSELKCIKYDISDDHSSDEKEKKVFGSKSSSKSKSSHKSSRQSGRVKNKRLGKNISKNSKIVLKNNRNNGGRNNIGKNKKNVENTNNDLNFNVKNSLDSSMDSYCLELSRLGMQSSYSGISVDKNNSRNSKTSCDVGIQANSHEITNQTLSSNDDNIKNRLNILKSSNFNDSGNFVNEKNDKKNIKQKKKADMVVLYKNENNVNNSLCLYDRNKYKNKSDNQIKSDGASELLLNKTNVNKGIIVKKRTDLGNMSEAKKLKQLLLPSFK